MEPILRESRKILCPLVPDDLIQLVLVFLDVGINFDFETYSQPPYNATAFFRALIDIREGDWIPHPLFLADSREYWWFGSHQRRFFFPPADLHLIRLSGEFSLLGHSFSLLEGERFLNLVGREGVDRLQWTGIRILSGKGRIEAYLLSRRWLERLKKRESLILHREDLDVIGISFPQ